MIHLAGRETKTIGKLLPGASLLSATANGGEHIVIGFRNPGCYSDPEAWATEHREIFTLVQKTGALIVPVDVDRMAVDLYAVVNNLQRMVGLRVTVVPPSEAPPQMEVKEEASLEAMSFYGKLKFNVAYAPFGVTDWREASYDIEEEVACNLCGGTSKILIRNAQCTGHNFVECTKCGFRYFSPRVAFSKALKKALGNSGQFSRVTLQDDYLDSFYGAHATNLERLSKKSPKSLLDVGCGSGYALGVFKSRWPKAKMMGCDISKWATGSTEGDRGIATHTGALEDLSAKTLGMHDIVTCFNYIEHTFTPAKDVKKMASRVRRGGLLLIQTFLTELDTELTMMSPPWHTGHFTEDLLVGLAERHGVKLVHSAASGLLWTGIFRK